MEAVLNVTDLRVEFETPNGPLAAVDGVSFAVAQGETLGIVGESGSGKSQILMAVMGLLAGNGRASGSVRLQGREILGLPERDLDRLRGAVMSMIFQDPMTSLNPYLRIRTQMAEVLTRHRGLGRRAARAAAVEMLRRVAIPEAERRAALYPHEFSGGMRQRVMIAMALLCEPALLLADEPTTALDVTVQAQILALLRDLGTRLGTASVLVTHDLGVVAAVCDRVLVLYGGRVMESAPAEPLFESPRHPYTQGLLASMPRLAADGDETLPLVAIEGQPPQLGSPVPGCPFEPRCPHRIPLCRIERPVLQSRDGRQVACHRVTL